MKYRKVDAAGRESELKIEQALNEWRTQIVMDLELRRVEILAELDEEAAEVFAPQVEEGRRQHEKVKARAILAAKNVNLIPNQRVVLKDVEVEVFENVLGAIEEAHISARLDRDRTTAELDESTDLGVREELQERLRGHNLGLTVLERLHDEVSSQLDARTGDEHAVAETSN